LTFSWSWILYKLDPEYTSGKLRRKIVSLVESSSKYFLRTEIIKKSGILFATFHSSINSTDTTTDTPFTSVTSRCALIATGEMEMMGEQGEERGERDKVLVIIVLVL
jgi:hypothetical protein